MIVSFSNKFGIILYFFSQIIYKYYLIFFKQTIKQENLSFFILKLYLIMIVSFSNQFGISDAIGNNNNANLSRCSLDGNFEQFRIKKENN